MIIKYPLEVIEGLAAIGLKCYGQYKICAAPEACEYGKSCKCYADKYSACERWAFSVNPKLGEAMDADKSYEVEYRFDDEVISVDTDTIDTDTTTADKLEELRQQMFAAPSAQKRRRRSL